MIRVELLQQKSKINIIEVDKILHIQIQKIILLKLEIIIEIFKLKKRVISSQNFIDLNKKGQ